MELFTLSSVFLAASVFLNAILIFSVYRNNPKSATNVIYSVLGFLISIWLIVNFISLHPAFLESSLFWIRLSIFFAAPMSFAFFLFAHTLPHDTLKIKKEIFVLLVLITATVMLLSISPYGFTGITIEHGSPKPTAGPGLAPFAALSTVFSIAAIYVLIQKFSKSANDIEKRQIRFVTFGILSLLGLIIAMVFIPVVFFGVNTFVSFIPLFALIFLITTAYAVVRHHLFHIKIIATEVLTLAIWIALLSRLVVSNSPTELLVNLFILSGTIIFGGLLVKTVRHEVEHREELQKLTAELKNANAQLEELSRFKTQLLSLASHQIKSPLAAIKGFISILLDGLYGSVEGRVRETLEKVKKSTDDLISLINMLLDLRRVEEGRMEYYFAKSELGALVRGVVEELQPLAEGKQLELSFAKPANELFVEADAQKLKQVIQNLIDNAIKYTPAGFVKIGLHEENKGTALLTVSDSGLGIPPELLPHVFEEFIRDERVKTKILGTGLGLFIAKKIIEAHNGQIWVESEGEGKGSRFYVRLKKI